MKKSLSTVALSFLSSFCWFENKRTVERQRKLMEHSLIYMHCIHCIKATCIQGIQILSVNTEINEFLLPHCSDHLKNSSSCWGWWNRSILIIVTINNSIRLHPITYNMKHYINIAVFQSKVCLMLNQNSREVKVQIWIILDYIIFQCKLWQHLSNQHCPLWKSPLLDSETATSVIKWISRIAFHYKVIILKPSEVST